MIIVSQRRTEIINFDNMTNVSVVKCIKNRFEILADSNNEINPLGYYNTKKRAKEVLEEILEYKSMFEFFKYVPDDVQEEMVDDFIKDNVIFNTYEMPEK